MGVCGCGRPVSVHGGRCVLCLKAGRRYLKPPERGYEPQTLRRVLGAELHEWGWSPLLKPKPVYVNAIARDAGVDVDVLDGLRDRLERLDQREMATGAAADRVRISLIRLVERLKEQVEGASLPQLDGYVRVRTG
jgi:hypothetical protein